jgi:hypothetical protein
MKYGIQWKRQCALLPAILADASINYKHWKKASSKSDTSALMREMEIELTRANRVFMLCYNTLYRSKRSRVLLSRTCCYAINAQIASQVTPASLNNFASMNATTLYKVCKRIDKKQSESTRTMQKWMTSLKDSKVYDILGGFRLTRLQLDCGLQTPMSCPICLQEEGEAWMILQCGHYVCCNCMFDLLQLRGVRGTLHNILSYGAVKQSCNPHTKTCPICRYARAFVPLHLQEKIWPSDASLAGVIST